MTLHRSPHLATLRFSFNPHQNEISPSCYFSDLKHRSNLFPPGSSLEIIFITKHTGRHTLCRSPNSRPSWGKLASFRLSLSTYALPSNVFKRSIGKWKLNLSIDAYLISTYSIGTKRTCHHRRRYRPRKTERWTSLDDLIQPESSTL